MKTNKKAQAKMKQILALVKDERKAEVEEKVKNATEKFLALSEDEQDDWFSACGTIDYFFDSNNLELDCEVHELLVNPDDEDDETDFIDLVCDYLDCFLD